MKFLKNSQVWGFFLSMAVMAVIALAFFAPDNFDGNSLMQHDMQQGTANSHESLVFQQQTGEKALWTNALFSGMPTFQISPSYPSNSLFDWINGLYGLWLPSPSNLLFMMMFGFLIMLYCMRMRWYYALIGAVAWGFSSYFIIIIGAGHIWKFLALTYIPPMIGGLVLCYRGRYLLGGALTALFAMMHLNANHPQMTYYFAFVMFGLAIAYLVDAYRSKKIKQWGIATASLVLAAALAVGANMPSLYNTYEYAKETKRAQSELVQPAADNPTAAERPTGGLPKSDIITWSYGQAETLSLMIPNIKGGASAKPVGGQMELASLDKIDAARDVPADIEPMLVQFTQYFNEGEGTNGPVYVGALIFALFLVGCFIVRGPVKWALVVLTIISILLAWGRNFMGLTDFMIYNFPMYSKFRAVESILVIAEFTIPLLAIMALAKILGASDDSDEASIKVRPVTFDVTKMRNVIIGCFGVCALVCLIGMIWPSIFGDPVTPQEAASIAQAQEANPQYAHVFQQLRDTVADLRLGMVRSDCLRSFLCIGLGFALLFFYLRNAAKPNEVKNGEASASRWSIVTVAGIGLIVLVDMYTVDKRYVSHESFVQQSPYAEVLAYDPFTPDAIDNYILQDTAQSYRVLDIPGFGSATRSYHHKMIGGYHAAKLNRYEDLIKNRLAHALSFGYDPMLRDEEMVELYSPEEQDVIRALQADYRVLDMLNARYIITGDKDYPLEYNDYALGNAWLVHDIAYVDGANAEMDALANIDPASQAVADRKFADVLGSATGAPAAGDTIYLTHYTPNTLTYHLSASQPAIAVFSEVYFPWGWKATIDGKPADIGRVNYVLRAMQVPAGDHTISMTFDPQSIHTTTTLAYICVILIYLWLIASLVLVYMRQRRTVA